MSTFRHFAPARRAPLLVLCAALVVVAPGCGPADAALPDRAGSTRPAPAASGAAPGSATGGAATGTPAPEASATPTDTPSTAVAPTTGPTRQASGTTGTGTPAPTATRSTTAAARTTAAAPGPSAGGAGLPDGTRLTPAGSMTITTAGSVVENLDVTGTIEVAATGVVIRNSRLTGTGQDYGVLVQPGGSVTIDHVEIRGNYSSAGFRGANLSLTRSEITGMTNDAGKIENNNVITGNVIHEFAPRAGAHSDGLQMETPAGGVEIAGNTIRMPGRGSAALDDVTSALFIVPQLASSYGQRAPGPVVVRDNVLGGGAHTTHFDSADFPLTDLRVTGNTFVDDSAYGPVYASGYRPAVWTGNTVQDGRTVAPPG